MSRLLGAIAAHRHAAPPSQAPPCVVGEDQRATVSLARSDTGEVLVAHASRQRLGDRRQQKLGRSPAPRRFKLEKSAAAAATLRHLAEPFVAREELVQGREFVDRLGRERPPHMLAHKTSEPLAQSARLCGDFVQFAWRGLRGQRSQHARRNEVGLGEPSDETIAAVEPINRRIDWRRDRIQEVEAEESAMKKAGCLSGVTGLSNQAKP